MASWHLVLLLLLVPGVAGADSFVAADLEVRGRMVYHGEYDLQVQSPGIVYHSTLERGNVSFQAEVTNANFRLVNFPKRVIQFDDGSPLGPYGFIESMPLEEYGIWTCAGALNLLSQQPGAV